MINGPMRLTAFLASVGGLLNAGYHFQNGNQYAALFFMFGVTALTIVCEIAVRKSTSSVNQSVPSHVFSAAGFSPFGEFV